MVGFQISVKRARVYARGWMVTVRAAAVVDRQEEEGAACMYWLNSACRFSARWPRKDERASERDEKKDRAREDWGEGVKIERYRKKMREGGRRKIPLVSGV